MGAHNIFAEMLGRIHRVSDELAAAGLLPSGVGFFAGHGRAARDQTHGDMATNVAMVLAKDAGKKPRDLAEAYAAKLRGDALVAKVDVAGPGFINLTLKPSAWIEVAARCRAARLRIRARRHRPECARQRRICFRQSDRAHACRPWPRRGVRRCLGKFARVHEPNVAREYYVNDAGAQVDVLARSAFLRYREALGETIGAIPEGLYPGDYLKPVGTALAAEFGDALAKQTESQWLPVVRAKAIAAMMEMVRADLAALNITPRSFLFRSSLVHGEVDQVAATIAWLRERGHVYEGRLPPPKGAPVEDWEDREQTLFRSTAFGDDVDRPLKKSDGSYTYFASDIAYHADKIRRGFRTLIDVWGADHGGYIKRMKAAVAALSDGKAELDVKLVQLVKLLRAGEPVKMSKRAGEFVTLREVVDEVGPDAVRFMMLFRKNDAVLDFDLAKVLEQSRDNPVFYVQYGHARGHSVFRNAREAVSDLPPLPDMVNAANLDLLADPAELALIRQIALFPRVVEAAAAAHEPHRIAFYLYDLASDFHALWTLGNASPHLRFIIQDDRELTMARLVLVQGVVTVLASGLALLGVGAPNEMR